MPTLTEILPVRKSSKRSAIERTAVTDNAFSHVAGVLTIHTERAGAAYTVSEFPTGWTGRGFPLQKLTEGTDPTNESYSMFCQPTRLVAASCDCRGHERFDHCKHVDSVVALIANGWL